MFLAMFPALMHLMSLCSWLTSDGQSGAPCDKLQEESLLLGIEAAQHLKQEPYGAAARTWDEKHIKRVSWDQSLLTTTVCYVRRKKKYRSTVNSEGNKMVNIHNKLDTLSLINSLSKS